MEFTGGTGAAVHLHREAGVAAGQHAAREVWGADEGRPTAAPSGEAFAWRGAAPGSPEGTLCHCCPLPARSPGEQGLYCSICL